MSDDVYVIAEAATKELTTEYCGFYSDKKGGRGLSFFLSQIYGSQGLVARHDHRHSEGTPSSSLNYVDPPVCHPSKVAATPSAPHQCKNHFPLQRNAKPWTVTRASSQPAPRKVQGERACTTDPLCTTASPTTYLPTPPPPVTRIGTEQPHATGQETHTPEPHYHPHSHEHVWRKLGGS